MEMFVFYKGYLGCQKENELKMPGPEAEGPAGRLHIGQVREGEKVGLGVGREGTLGGPEVHIKNP